MQQGGSSSSREGRWQLVPPGASCQLRHLSLGRLEVQLRCRCGAGQGGLQAGAVGVLPGHLTGHKVQQGAAPAGTSSGGMMWW